MKRRKIEFEGRAAGIELGAGHHEYAQINSSPDPSVFVVRSHQIWAEGDGSSERMEAHRYDRHAVDLVNVGEKTAVRLSGGKGDASVAWAPDGTLYLQTYEGIRRYAPGKTDAQDDVISGIELELPAFPQVGGV